MISRNQIRQTALQFIYSALITPDAGTTPEGLWELLLEPFSSTYYHQRAKAVSGHLTRDYSDKLNLFVKRCKETSEKLQSDALTLPVRDRLQDILAKEGEFNAALLQMKKDLHADPRNERGTLADICVEVQNLNTTLLNMRSQLLHSLKDYPACKEIWAPLTAATNKLQEIGVRVDCIIHPEGNASLPEALQVIESGKDVQTLKEEAETLATQTLSHKDALNRAIDATLENYSPERVAPMDRAVLLLAANELSNAKNLPTEVIVSEAIRLAKRYSTAESVKFINGVLGKLATTLRPA